MAVPAADVKAAQALPVDAIAGRAKRRRFRFLTGGKAVTGLSVLVFFVVIAVIGEWIAPYDPSARSNDLLEGPSGRHWFGTTHLGQDIFSQVVVGTRSVMLVGLTAGIVATILAVLVGVTSGYLGGTPGEGLSALSNVFLVIPALPLIIIIGSAVPTGGDYLVAVIIGFTSWAWGARVLERRRFRCVAGNTSKRPGRPASRRGGSSSSRSCRT